MITRIAATTKVSLETPTCNRSKSRATMQQHTKIITNSTTTSIPAGQLIAMAHTKKNRTATTMRHCCLVVLQVLVLACALPPPLQPLLPVALLPPRWSFVVEALPITSKPIEGTAENLAWQAWLMLPPEQKQLEKSRKVTPKSIFSLPFRDCPPGHQLFQSRCIPTVNINQSDLLTQQVLGLFVGNEGTAGSDNAYEIDYEDEEYGLGFGEGEPAVMYESAQSFNDGSAAGSGNAQQPPARDEPLKFNLFQQKYPTNDYEADISSGAVEGSGGARPLTEMLPMNMSEGDRIDGVASNDNHAGTTFFNTTQFLDVVQGFFQRHSATSSGVSNANTTTPNANTTGNNNRITNGNSTNSHRVSDLHATSSNMSAFAVGDIDAIILSAANSGISATTVRSSSGGGGVGGSAAGGDLEPHRISLFKDDNSVQLVTTVIAQSDSDNHTSNEDAIRANVGDLVAAAQQQQNSFAQFLRADALLPLSSVAPYVTTTTTSTSTSTFSADDAGYATKPPPPATKDERPRSVMEHNSAEAATNTDAQELSFTTTTEAESTTSFQIDDTTVVEENAEFANAPEGTSLLEAISKQQQLEFQKSKVEPVEDLAPITTTTINEETTTVGDNTTSTETTKTIVNETDGTTTTTTTKQAFEVNEKSVKTTTRAETTTQPLPNAVALPSKIIATTTPKTILTTTPYTNRLRSTPVAIVAPIHVAAGKQVSAAVNSVAPQAANIISRIAGEETAASSTDIVSDVPRSGNSDLVNVVAASSSINSDTNNNNNKNKNNKKMPIRSKAAEAAVPTSEINIQQELRMINELVKGNRQLAATKMAAIKTTTSTSTSATATATATTTLPTAIEPKLDLKKSANVVENEQNVSRVEMAVEVEERRDVDAATKTQLAAITAEDAMVDNSPGFVTSGNEDEVLQTTTTTTGAGGTTAATPQAQTSTKMESGSPLTEATTVENIKTATALGKIIELATTTSAQPYFETEATAVSTEVTGATLWSRIMPLFGFGAIPPAVEDEAEAEATTAITTIITTTPQEIAGSYSFGSISSNSSDSTQNSHNSSSSSSNSSTISDISSVSKNVNNNNIINSNNNFGSHSRRNSKIIRIDQLSDDSVPAATTNTLEDTAATNMDTTTKTTTATAEAEQSTYWWLPAGWRANRDTNNEQSLLFRLWSAFPESQMKAKVRT